ncbi:MAG: hypothetical protein ACREKN_06415 [Longimicrobiaceae bacterium]
MNQLFWALTLAGLIFLLFSFWRGSMRRRGARLARVLEEKEGVLRSAVEAPVRFTPPPAGESPPPWSRRGTLVLTRVRLAGFAGRARFVLVKGGGARPGMVAAEQGWLVVRPRGKAGRAVWYHLADAEEWVREARKMLGP